MKIITQINEINDLIFSYKCQGKIIGFVPTMGALHEGHLSLIEISKKENDISVCSIFVNPTQFNNPDDFQKYPIQIDSDIQLLKNVGCDILFMPHKELIYNEKTYTKFNFDSLEQVMEGKYRPGHFNGVALIVSKLFNIVAPHNVYFGQKDFQQYSIVRQMVVDLSFSVKIHCCSTIREKSGLAMSSRNQRLSEAQRDYAANIYKGLILAKELLNSGVDVKIAKTKIEQFYKSCEQFKLDYFEICHKDSLQPIDEIADKSKIILCVAVYLGDVRLIDNIFLE